MSKHSERDEIRDPYAAKLASPLYRFFDRLYLLFNLHILMLLGILLGLGVFGLFPTLLAAAEWLDESLKGREGRMWQRFFELWRRRFAAGSRLAAVVYGSLAAGGGVWYLLWYLRQPLLATVLNLVFFLAVFALLLLILYYPVLRLYYTHMSEKRLWIFSVLFGFGHFGTTLILFLTLGAIVFISMLVPQMAIFVFLSLLPWVSLVLCRRKLPPGLLNNVTDEDEALRYDS